MNALRSLIPFRKKPRPATPAPANLRYDDWWWEEPVAWLRRQTQIVPEVDVIDRDRDYLIQAGLPGWRKEDLELSADEHTVTLRGTLRRESRDQRDGYLRQERRLASFERRIRLAGPLAPQAVKARLKNGVLEMVVPKAEPAGFRKKIEVDNG